MKKIGIITFHKAVNYGAILQTYALQTVLQNLSISNKNIEVSVIDYQSKIIESAYSPSISFYKGVKNFIKDIFLFNIKKRKKEKFNEFIKKYIILDNYDSKYKAVITGSDQVFNLDIIGNDYGYFLDFVKGKCNKYSYAASFGNMNNYLRYSEKINYLLSDFKCISIRERDMFELLNNNIVNNKRYDIDPTLLLTQKDWEKLRLPNKLKKPYILIYNFTGLKEVLEVAINLVKEKKLNIYCFCDEFWKYKNVKKLSAKSPQEFVTYFMDAEYIFTSSFHGTIFSILFKKKFYSYTGNGDCNNDRIYNLLQLLNLKERDFSNYSIDNYDKEIDYKEVDKKIEKEREKAYCYLVKIISNM